MAQSISPSRKASISKDILPKALPKRVNIDFNNSTWYSPSERKKKTDLRHGLCSSKNLVDTNLIKKRQNLSPSAEVYSKVPKVADLLRDRKESKKQEEIDKLIKKSKLPRKRKKNTEDLHRGLCSPKKLIETKFIKKRKYLSPSAKLDSKIPKVADLLRQREESKKLEEIDKLIKKSSTQFLKGLREDKLKVKEKPKQKIKDINCKHITLKQLDKNFRKDVEYLDGVFSGEIHCKRHDIFHEQLITGDKLLKGDLRISESMTVFTSDQLIHIVSLFRERYDNGNKYKHSDYYFKVLLPEYCLKIFMNCYKMSQENALEYLKNIPVPNVFGLKD